MKPQPIAASAPCPHCACSMHEVAARARSGYLILLDQCPRCGGVWCDRWELFPLAAEEAERIDAVDETQLQRATAPDGARGRCPRCTVPLQPFRDPLLPPDARIERCRVCDGMWLNHGGLSRVKRRAARRLGAADLDTLAAHVGAPATWATVSNLDAATYTRDPATELDETSAALRSAGPWLIVQTLLRLVLGR